MLTYNNSLHKITLQFGVTALHLARNAKVAELLIENGAKIELISNVRKHFYYNNKNLLLL